MKNDFWKKLARQRKLIIILSLIVGFFLLWLVFKDVTLKEVLDSFKSATLEMVIYYVIVQLLIIVILTWRWKVILDSQGIKNVNFFRLNSYRLVGQAIGFVTPSAKLGGEPVRAGLLSTRENIPFKTALSSVVIDKTIELSTSASFFVLGVIIVMLSFVVNPEIMQLMIIISAVFLVLVIWFNYRMLKGKAFFLHIFEVMGLSRIKGFKKIGRKIKEFESLIIKFYHKDTKYFYYTLLISFMSWLVMFFEYKIAGQMVGQDLSLMQIFLIFSFVGAAYTVPIPMALGALEAGQYSIFGIIRVSQAAGLGLGLLIRLKDVIITIIGFILLAVYGLKLKDAVKETNYIDKDIHKLEKDEK